MNDFKLKVIYQQSANRLEDELNEFINEENVKIIKIDYKVAPKFDIYKKYEVIQYFAFIHYTKENKNGKTL